MRMKLLKRTALCMLSSVCLLSQSAVAFADARGTWKYEEGSWKHYNAAGEKSIGWILSGENWYYLDAASKVMKTGWHRDSDGHWYFLSTAEGAELGKMLTGWVWVDGYCYYLKENAPNRGSLYIDTETPGGYRVDKEGRWVEKEGTPVYQSGKGLSSKSPAKEEKAAEKKAAGKAGRASGSSGGSGSGGGSGSRSGSGSGSASGSGGTAISESKEQKDKEKIQNQGNEQNQAENLSKNQGGDSSDHSGNTAGETNTPGNANQSGSDINAGGNDANAGGSDTNAGGSDANAGGNDANAGGSDANAGGSDANAGGSGGDSSSGSGQAAAESLLHASETKVISREIGWVKYVAISFKSGSLEDYEVFIDGTDISAALTKVDSAGKIVKWMSTVKDPKELRVVRKSDGQQEVLALGEGAASTGPEAGNPEDAPKYVFTNGPISRFDYFLDHYDQNGEVRTLPSGTTFDLEAVSDQNAGEGNLPGRYYSPDTLIDERGNGKLLIKLSLANEEQSRWFDNLERIKALNDENRPVNDNINFTKRIETVHGKTGVIEVALPQTNFFNRGRYSFVLYSAANKAITIPVHLVDKNKFELLLNSSTPSPRTGDKIMFNIVSADTSIDPTFGNDLKNPIRRVLLVKPSGEKLELEKIKHWALIGDLFNIYGSDPEKKEILTDEPGIYTIRIYADGYQSIEKKIEIARGDITAGEGTNSFAAVSAVSLLNGVDALSSASGNIGDGGSDGGSSGGGIGGSINGYYLFEHDLLINAHILNDIRPGNPQVKAVLDRYFSHVPVMAGDSFAKLYDFNRYLGAVRDKRLEGQEMSFVQYLAADGGKIAKTKPREYRYVLEDGLLGSLQKFSEALGKDFPVLKEEGQKKERASRSKPMIPNMFRQSRRFIWTATRLPSEMIII